MKTKEELDALKKEVKALEAKLSELTEDELKEVIGGAGGFDVPENDNQYEYNFYPNSVSDNPFKQD